ncbi:MAG: class I SAM-dependent methyltransferase [Actinobacteria bacterium]|nr:class I SAM-dependent methyltransferase [Actinomycetota bacterium]
MTWDGEDYQRRFDALAGRGVDVHGEVDFVMRFQPGTVLDAGCGTGRVAIELGRRGVSVVGVDADPSMIGAARARAPHLEWHEADLEVLELRREFEVVVMAGNVPLFTAPGTRQDLVGGCARHLVRGGKLIVGFQTDRGYGVDAYDDHASAAGLVLVERYATWDGAPYNDGDYAVSVHTQY